MLTDSVDRAHTYTAAPSPFHSACSCLQCSLFPVLATFSCATLLSLVLPPTLPPPLLLAPCRCSVLKGQLPETALAPSRVCICPPPRLACHHHNGGDHPGLTLSLFCGRVASLVTRCLWAWRAWTASPSSRQVLRTSIRTGLLWSEIRTWVSWDCGSSAPPSPTTPSSR